jgi:hypothetical protein
VRGLRARGGLQVAELAWSQGRLARVEVVSDVGGPLEVGYGKVRARLKARAGERIRLDPSLRRVP